MNNNIYVNNDSKYCQLISAEVYIGIRRFRILGSKLLPGGFAFVI